MSMLTQGKCKRGSYAKYLLAKKKQIGQLVPMILVVRTLMLIFAVLMFSATTSHAAMPMVPELADAVSMEHCGGEMAACNEVVDHHGSSEEQLPSCCAISCHIGVQTSIGHSAFLTVTRTLHVTFQTRDEPGSPVTNLDRPPRLA